MTQQQVKGGKVPHTREVAVVVDDNEIAAADPQVPTEVAVVEFLPPHYDFAGANLGGQSVYNCGICWSTVLRDAQAAHTAWHEALHKAGL